jgi:hypothetical protein
MGAVPTVYRWDDAGVPGRPGGNTGYDKINYIAEVLRACLVNGYGSKSAAGWAELHYSPAAGGTYGQLVLTNSEQLGVAQLSLNHTYYSFRESRLGTGWESGELVGDVGVYANSFRYTDDIQSMRWCVIANDASAVLLIWPPPDGLTGDGLSEDNCLCLAMGSVLPWGSGIDPRAVPNFVIYTAYYVDAANDNSFQDSQGLISLIEPDGSVNTGQTSGDFTMHPGLFNRVVDAQILEGTPQLPLYPVALSRNSRFFARVPGWYSAIGTVEPGALIDLRDQDNLWTGDQTSMNGRSVVLIANQYHFGYISLEPEDWP